MPGFEAPNHTQVPNDLFDVYLPQLKAAELRVLLAVIRQTIGFQRKKRRMSVTFLAGATGLSRRAAFEAGNSLSDNWHLLTANKGKGVTEWSVNWTRVRPTAVDQSSTIVPYVMHPSSTPSKERNVPKEKDLQRPNGRAPLISELVKAFSSESGLPVPNESYPEGAKRAYVLWRLPLAELADSCQNEEGKSRAVLRDAIKRMRNEKLTISSPKSVVAVAASILAEGTSSAETPAARWRRENL